MLAGSIDRFDAVVAHLGGELLNHLLHQRVGMDRGLGAALAFGAAGFIPKSATLSQMTEALRAIRDGDAWTPPLSVSISVHISRRRTKCG